MPLKIFVSSLFFTAVCLTTAFAQTFTNPLRKSGPDPFIVYNNGFYYLTYTINPADQPGGNGIEVVKTASLADISRTDASLVWQETDKSKKYNMWAPELHRLKTDNGFRWYLYYTSGPDMCCEGQRIHVLESDHDDPMGPYNYKTQLTKDYSIDGSVFTIGETLYFLYCKPYEGNHIYISSMKNPYTLEGPSIKISSPRYAWERAAGVVNEAPIALIRNGKIFVTYSYNDCSSANYGLGMLTADVNSDLLDANSWHKSQTPVFERNEFNAVYGPGHNGFFKSPDGREDWIVFHANDTPTDGCSAQRSPRAQKIGWNADGTPDFGMPLALSSHINLPSGDPGPSGEIFLQALQETDNTSFKIYPNPSKEIVHIDYIAETDEIITIQVLDANGKLRANVCSRYVTKGVTLKETFSLEGFQMGIYIIKVSSGSVNKHYKVQLSQY